MLMKYVLTALLFLLGLHASAQTAQTSFHVSGNCEMCKARIEKAAKMAPGVSAADWDEDSKRLTLSYDKAKTKLRVVKKLIAGAGHDTDETRADDEVYDNLHGCCQYDRSQADKTKAKSE